MEQVNQINEQGVQINSGLNTMPSLNYNQSIPSQVLNSEGLTNEEQDEMNQLMRAVEVNNRSPVAVNSRSPVNVNGRSPRPVIR
jgi:hypothetical protein